MIGLVTNKLIIRQKIIISLKYITELNDQDNPIFWISQPIQDQIELIKT